MRFGIITMQRDALIPAGMSMEEAMEWCLPCLGEIHLHDGPWQGPEGQIGYGRDHVPLGAGDLDVGRLLDRLAEAGFAGPIIFELTVEEALASLEVIRALRPDMLAQGVGTR